jgi:VIT1/CCC1 family predicted Fe2+/Mn2+ transporter
VVAGSAGAGFASHVAITLGVANLLADGFSMGVSSYLAFMTEAKMTRVRAFNKALFTFLSFVTVGTIPLLSFLLFNDHLFLWSCIFTASGFVLIGLLKGYIVNNNSYLRSIFGTLLLGGIAATLAYVLGSVLESLMIG